MYKVIVWKNLNKNTYYYKIVKGTYKNYFIGYVNQYNHEVIIIIDNIYLSSYKVPIKKKVLTRAISFLQKLNR
ncbi:MAG: hypothetical protein PUB18_04085 [bacterium]|nr:hypothetical protein [bacterium]